MCQLADSRLVCTRQFCDALSRGRRCRGGSRCGLELCDTRPQRFVLPREHVVLLGELSCAIAKAVHALLARSLRRASPYEGALLQGDGDGVDQDCLRGDKFTVGAVCTSVVGAVRVERASQGVLLVAADVRANARRVT